MTSPRHVAFVLFDEVNFLDVAGPLEAFSMADKTAASEGRAGYRLSLVSLHGGAIRTSAGFDVDTRRCAEIEAIDTLLVPGGGPPHAPLAPAPLASWIAREALGVRRLCSVCTGAFLLAAAGCLEGRRVTTHWGSAKLLQRRASSAHIDPEPIFVRDGAIWTSAGVTAGIDLALALIEEDLGFAVAMRVAKNLVVYLRRPGTQSQYSNPLSLQIASDREFGELHAWVREHLNEDLSVERLADRAGMSARSFARHHKLRTGETPARMVETMRLEAARHALLQGKLTLKQVARDHGFGDERTLRRAFVRRFGKTPSQFIEREER